MRQDDFLSFLTLISGMSNSILILPQRIVTSWLNRDNNRKVKIEVLQKFDMFDRLSSLDILCMRLNEMG